MTGRGFDRVISGENRSLPASVMRGGLSVGAVVYGAAVSRRNRAFDRGQRQPVDLQRATVSVGNITAGGTGKTPIVLELTRRLLRLGRKPAILLRGYHGKEVDPAFTQLGEGGPPPPRFLSDEQMLYRRETDEAVPVAADPDRARSAEHILHHQPETDVFVLDDGFQHRQVKRDLDIVLLDATCPFGHGHLLPRGLLREPASSLERATFVIVTRSDMVPHEELARIDRQVMNIAHAAPLAHAVHQWGGYTDHQGAQHPPDKLQDARVLAVCGIGNPAAFETAVRERVGQLLDLRRMADHHPYTQADLDQIFSAATKAGAGAVLTTDKDWVKWEPLLEARQPPLPVYRPVLRIGFLKGSQAIDMFLRRLRHDVEPGSVDLTLPLDSSHV